MGAMSRVGLATVSAAVLSACSGCGKTAATTAVSASPSFPLAQLADAPLPGGATRFDYQEIDPAHGHLVVAHMNDASVLVLNLADASVAKLLPSIPTPRGVAVGDGRIFVTSSPAQLVVVDGAALTEIARVATGTAPDGVGYDPADHVVGVSDQQDGAISLIGGAGTGGQGDRQRALRRRARRRLARARRRRSRCPSPCPAAPACARRRAT